MTISFIQPHFHIKTHSSHQSSSARWHHIAKLTSGKTIYKIHSSVFSSHISINYFFHLHKPTTQTRNPASRDDEEGRFKDRTHTKSVTWQQSLCSNTGQYAPSYMVLPMKLLLLAHTYTNIFSSKLHSNPKLQIPNPKPQTPPKILTPNSINTIPIQHKPKHLRRHHHNRLIAIHNTRTTNQSSLIHICAF